MESLIIPSSCTDLPEVVWVSRLAECGHAPTHVEHTNEAIKVMAGGVRVGGDGMLGGVEGGSDWRFGSS